MTTAHDIGRALCGRPSGDGILCRCPVPTHGKGNGDRRPSLLVREGDKAPLFHCFAGCDSRDVLAELRRRGIVAGVAGDRFRKQSARLAPSAQSEHERDAGAWAMWSRASSASGSVVSQYLESRGIAIAPPPSLRCGSILHLDRYPLPAMLAAVQRPDGIIVSVQATLLTPQARKAPVAHPRITTGSLGAGAVRFAKAADTLGIAEGIETALSAMQLSGIPTWACLGAGRMHRVEIPDCVRELHIFGDNDEPGRAAAERIAAVHTKLGRRVVLRFPECAGDWNDHLQTQARRAA